MRRKVLWTLGGLLVLAVGIVPLAIFYFGLYSPPYDPSRQQLPTAPQPDKYSYAISTSTDGVVTMTPVQVTAITSAAITVRTSLKQTRTFTLGANTPVYSHVLAGQTGKGLSDIAVGTLVTVMWKGADPAAATALAFPRDAALGLTADDNTHVLAGTITRISASAITITPADTGTPVDIHLSAATKVATIVTAGATGREPKVGDMVVARGVSTSGTETTAKAIIILPPRQ